MDSDRRGSGLQPVPVLARVQGSAGKFPISLCCLQAQGWPRPPGGLTRTSDPKSYEECQIPARAPVDTGSRVREDTEYQFLVLGKPPEGEPDTTQ